MKSEVDGDKDLTVRMQFRDGGGMTAAGYVELKNGSWAETFRVAGRAGASVSFDVMVGTKVEVTPHSAQHMDRTMFMARQPLTPDVYAIHGGNLSAPFFLRVRRSAKAEREYPKKLLAYHDWGTVQWLGEQRIRAAGPVLLDWFERGRSSGANKALFYAMARSGHPAVIEYLLDTPEIPGSSCGRESTVRPLFEAGVVVEQACQARVSGLGGSSKARAHTCLEILAPLVDARHNPLWYRLMMDEKSDPVVFAWAARFVGESDPAAAADAVWTRYGVNGNGGAVGNVLAGMTGDVEAEVLRKLWHRWAASAERDPTVKAAMVKRAMWSAPALVEADEGPIKSEEEALVILVPYQWRNARIEPTRALVRAATFLTTDDSSAVRVALAEMYNDVGNTARCEELLTGLPDAFPEGALRARAWVARADARLKMGKTVAGEADLRSAVNHRVDGFRVEQSIHDRLAAVSRLLDSTARVRFPLTAPIDLMSRVEMLGGRAFYLVGRDIRSIDVGTGKASAAIRLDEDVRTFVPADERRVIVTLADGTVAAYESGRGNALWLRKGPWSKAENLSSSSSIVTFADEAKVLHVLDTETGTTLWTRSVGNGWRLLHAPDQDEASPCLPVRTSVMNATRVTCHIARTGEVLWSADLSDAFSGWVVVDGRLVVVDRQGVATAIDLQTGVETWRVHLQIGSPGNAEIVAHARGREAFVWNGHSVWSLNGSDGTTKWHWQWKGSRLEKLVVTPTLQDVYVVASWRSSLRYQAQVILLGDDGEERFSGRARDSEYREISTSAQGDSLFLRHGVHWEIWQPASLR